MTATNTKEMNAAIAKSTNLPISTKHCIEIGHHIRYRSTSFAKKFLEDVLAERQAVPFRRFYRDVGHRRGMSAGRYPVKAASQFILLIKSVEANAQAKGLNTSSLKISKVIANRAATPMGGGRHRHSTKRTHLEIEVIEGVVKKKISTKEKRTESKPVVKTEVKPVEKTVKKEEQKESKVEKSNKMDTNTTESTKKSEESQ